MPERHNDNEKQLRTGTLSMKGTSAARLLLKRGPKRSYIFSRVFWPNTKTEQHSSPFFPRRWCSHSLPTWENICTLLQNAFGMSQAASFHDAQLSNLTTPGRFFCTAFRWRHERQPGSVMHDSSAALSSLPRSVLIAGIAALPRSTRTSRRRGLATTLIRPPRWLDRYLPQPAQAEPSPKSSSRSSPGSAWRAWSRRLFTPIKNWRIMTTMR